MNIDDIIRLWYKTQRGHVEECREAQLYFSEVMWEFYNNLKEKE